MTAALQLHPAVFESGQPDADGLQEIVSFNHETGSHFPGMSGPKKSGRSQGQRGRSVSLFGRFVQSLGIRRFPLIKARKGNMLKIRPHHFMDMIKLYGKGIDVFVPDTDYNHDFFSVANKIVLNHDELVTITLKADTICTPCKYIGEDGACLDVIGHIPGITSKNAWNDVIDNRICTFSEVKEDTTLTAESYCKILYAINERIAEIWLEESSTVKNERHKYFCLGAEKYLNAPRSGL